MQMIFVCGCGHSGTSLIAAMLGAHPDVHSINFETNVFRERNSDAEIVALFDRHAAAIDDPGVTHLCEKTPRHIGRIGRMRRLYPRSFVVIPVRDPRDVCASVKKRKHKLADGLERWLSANSIVRSLVERNAEAFVFRYEDLIEDPTVVLTALCRHVGLEFSDAMLEFYKDDREWFGATERRETDGRQGRRHNILRNWQIHQPLMDRRGLWRSGLKLAEVDEIAERCGELAGFFGYDLSERPSRWRLPSWLS